MLDGASARISGRPTADGDFRFTVTATDASGATGQANYTLSVLSTNFVFSPSAGALQDAMVGEDYSSRISVTGGVGELVYSVKSGDLPKGMVLNISTGEPTGPIADDATPDDYRFTIAVVDSRGASGSAAYTLRLKGRSGDRTRHRRRRSRRVDTEECLPQQWRNWWSIRQRRDCFRYTAQRG